MIAFHPSQLVRLRGMRKVALDNTLAEVRSVLQDDGRHEISLYDDVQCKLMKIEPMNMVHACSYCHDAGRVEMRCSQCTVAVYCNAECQRNDWNRHKHDCTPHSPTEPADPVLERSPIHSAIEQGDVATVLTLLQQGVGINAAVASDGSTPLHIAVSRGNLAMVSCLVERGANKDQAAENGFTPFHVAAESGHLEIAQHLAQQGAATEITECNGLTPLHLAVGRGHFRVVQFLVQQGANKDCASHRGMTPLHVAAQQGLPLGDSAVSGTARS